MLSDARLGLSRRPPQEQAELAADVADLLAALAPEDRAVAEAFLREGGVAATARALGVTRWRVYRALGRWRQLAADLGLADYL